jgi:hypothetical protein
MRGGIWILRFAQNDKQKDGREAAGALENAG